MFAMQPTSASPPPLIGQSPAFLAMLDEVSRVAALDRPVLVIGERGTGKELVAARLHFLSRRWDKPLIKLNCAALAESLLESELFGHEAGAFTGAAGKKLGRFELAEGGTIFLDEIGEVAPSIQVKLLRVLQEKEIVRVGGTRTIGCDVRVIAATNRDLVKDIHSGRFREDLYYRINVFPITVPPLRDRREDIPLLANHFVQKIAADMKRRPPQISPEALAALVRYNYPGNIRELQNVLERACLLCTCMEEDGEGCCILPEHLPHDLLGDAPGPAGETNALAGSEKAMVLNALRQSNWNQTRAAKALGISRDNMRYRIKKFGIEMPRQQ